MLKPVHSFQVFPLIFYYLLLTSNLQSASGEFVRLPDQCRPRSACTSVQSIHGLPCSLYKTTLTNDNRTGEIERWNSPLQKEKHTMY